MYFSPIMTPAALWLLFACFVCVLLLASLYFFRVRNVVAYRRRADRERPDKPDAAYLPASVIVYSQGDADALTALLGSLLNQDYPAAFEVIVVNDGESADVRDNSHADFCLAPIFEVEIVIGRQDKSFLF